MGDDEMNFLDKKIKLMKDTAYQQGFDDQMKGCYDPEQIRKDLDRKIPLKYRNMLRRMNIDVDTEFFKPVLDQYMLGMSAAKGDTDDECIQE